MPPLHRQVYTYSYNVPRSKNGELRREWTTPDREKRRAILIQCYVPCSITQYVLLEHDTVAHTRSSDVDRDVSKETSGKDGCLGKLERNKGERENGTLTWTPLVARGSGSVCRTSWDRGGEQARVSEVSLCVTSALSVYTVQCLSRKYEACLTRCVGRRCQRRRLRRG